MLNQPNIRQMDTICRYTVDEYIDMLIQFHGNFAPGLLIGGFMVDAAVQQMTPYEFFDAICESTSCLPDAIQMLTPCTVGNGWLKIVNTGRFAIALYEKRSGDGVRVSMDVSKLDQCPEIRNWFMRLISKHDQDKNALLSEIKTAGRDILSIRPVKISSKLLGKRPRDPIALCESCGEAFPTNGSVLCPACKGVDLFEI
ncbi:MAG: formylmethanofuran dehydrogenase subunit E family protein [Anaerolineae bacterium]|nr:formylmethanofuran dehydrogenase subunit E family protein [Anaerolineae bacterium]